jgi:hypothetical protein
MFSATHAFAFTDKIVQRGGTHSQPFFLIFDNFCFISSFYLSVRSASSDDLLLSVRNSLTFLVLTHYLPTLISLFILTGI